jgi:hypothetical protein
MRIRFSLGLTWTIPRLFSPDSKYWRPERLPFETVPPQLEME